MLFRSVSAIAGIVYALAGNGPAVLYNRLRGLTFNPPGYTIVMYQSCMQNQNAGNPCGSFSTFESSNGVYTTQLYGPEAPVSPSCSRTFRLALACGATMSMSGVNENPTCVYSATLTLPEACGVDMTVGNEAASASGTVAPPTASITRSSTATYSGTTTTTSTPSYTISSTGSSTYTVTSTGTLTSSGTPSFTITSSITATGSVSAIPSLTSTPLFEITAYPSRTVSPSVAATTTPLFMVTAYPTTSPVNASGPSLLDTLGITPGSSTATILGAVAVGVLGIALIAGGIYYFKNGGSVKGLVKKFEENKDTIKKVTGSVADLLPLTEDQKKKIDSAIDNPSSVVPQQIVQVAEKAQEYKTQVIAALPISAEQKVQLTAAVDSLQEKALKRIESTPAGSEIKSVISLISPSSAPPPVVVTPPTSVAPVAETAAKPAAEPAAEPATETTTEPALVAVHINAEDLASVQAFLASKKSDI